MDAFTDTFDERNCWIIVFIFFLKLLKGNLFKIKQNKNYYLFKKTSCLDIVVHLYPSDICKSGLSGQIVFRVTEYQNP